VAADKAVLNKLPKNPVQKLSVNQNIHRYSFHIGWLVAMKARKIRQEKQVIGGFLNMFSRS
jgi:hypothetical protein